mmetsp:Transcript_9762/g.29284  ORF Transcript_9762/g.29284 Transcript_9762/m.29284 type:complete len:234 (-) Transcript_9762:940-1641(-)
MDDGRENASDGHGDVARVRDPPRVRLELRQRQPRGGVRREELLQQIRRVLGERDLPRAQQFPQPAVADVDVAHVARRRPRRGVPRRHAREEEEEDDPERPDVCREDVERLLRLEELGRHVQELAAAAGPAARRHQRHRVVRRSGGRGSLVRRRRLRQEVGERGRRAHRHAKVDDDRAPLLVHQQVLQGHVVVREAHRVQSFQPRHDLPHVRRRARFLETAVSFYDSEEVAVRA